MRLLQRFSIKLSLLFLFLLLLMGISQAFITLRIIEMRSEESNQKVNWNLAADMAAEIAPVEKEDYSVYNIESAIHYMMVLNPRIEVYILDKDGYILAYFAAPGIVKTQRIDLNPVISFIKSGEKKPILGQDPRNPDKLKYFSTAEIDFSDSTTGYLYIILRSSLYDDVQNLSEQETLIQSISWAFTLSVIFIGIAGLTLFSLLTKRLRLLYFRVKDFGSGILNSSYPVKHNDEIDEIGTAFNEMAKTIKSNINELKAAAKDRKDLFANISHDLKNPLTSIQGYLETLIMKHTKLSEEEINEFLGIISSESEKLKILIDNLFQLSMLDAKQIKPVFEKISIGELLQDEFLSFSQRAEKKGIELKLSVPQKSLLVNGDIKLLSRAVSNLLDNALKFTEKNGSIILSAEEIESKLHIKIKDTGPGIEADQITEIFKRFKTGKSSRSGIREGSGLGLAIASGIIRLHSSKLKVKSEYGKGSEFYFEINLEL